MTFTCPECGATLKGGRPGAAVACGACANPVVVPARVERAPEAPPAAPVPTGRPPRSPWATAGIVLGVVGLAHVGLFLALTMDARKQKATLETRYPLADLRAAERPREAMPPPGTPAYEPWRRAQELWSASEDHARHRTHVTLLRTGLFFSFLVQVGITGWILMRVVGGQRALARRDARRP